MGFKNVGFNIKNVTENIIGKIVGMKLRTSSGTTNNSSSSPTGQSVNQNETRLREFHVQNSRVMAYYGRLCGKL